MAGIGRLCETWQLFCIPQMTKSGVDAEKAPTVLAMAEALSERNVGLMGAILALMIRAEAEPLYRSVMLGSPVI